MLINFYITYIITYNYVYVFVEWALYYLKVQNIKNMFKEKKYKIIFKKHFFFYNPNTVYVCWHR